MNLLARGLAGLLLLTALAGCSGGGDGDADVQGGVSASGTVSASSDPTSSSGSSSRPSTHGNSSTSATTSAGTNTSSSATNGTGNGTENGNGNATEWRYDNRSGSLSGNELLVVQASSETESFEGDNGTPNGTVSVLVDLVVDGDEVTMTVSPPGCDAAECQKTATTSDGKANLSFAEPPEGDWSVELAIDGGLGPVSSDYELSFGVELPVANTQGNGTVDGNGTTNGTSTTGTTTATGSGTSGTATSSTSASQTTTGAATRR